jgi:hypothetical protein
MTRPPDASARPLLIGGMHRSGTSLTASLVASAGIDLGPELLGANASNPAGHFEDLGIQEFHCRALVAQGVCSEGYTATMRGDVPAALEPQADDLLAERMRPGVAWGWKEPRTTLFLDFWQRRLPQARHLFVFRRPWEVADSLFRRGDQTFLDNPTFAFDVWAHYNRTILDFVRRHPVQCVIVDIAQVIANPQRVFADVRSRLDVALGRPATRYREGMLARDVGFTRAAIVRAVAPEAWQTYVELCSLAGATDEFVTVSGGDASIAECAVLEWARASRAETEALPETAARPVAGRPLDRSRQPSLAAAVRRTSTKLLARLTAVGRRLLPAGRAVAPPDVLAFPTRVETPPAQRVA